MVPLDRLGRHERRQIVDGQRSAINQVVDAALRDTPPVPEAGEARADLTHCSRGPHSAPRRMGRRAREEAPAAPVEPAGGPTAAPPRRPGEASRPARLAGGRGGGGRTGGPAAGRGRVAGRGSPAEARRPGRPGRPGQTGEPTRHSYESCWAGRARQSYYRSGDDF